MLRQSPLHESIIISIPAYAAGPGGYLTVPYLVRLLQQAAMRNTLTLKVSSPELIAAHNLSWVLRRQRITCRHWPKMNDAVTILTAPTGFERRLLTYRDFHVLGPNDEPLMSAVSEWLLMDITSRRPRPIPPNVARLEKDLAPAAAHLEKPSGKLDPPEKITAQTQTRVTYGMLDFNDHLTNPIYPELMLEPLGKEFLTTHLPSELDISFVAEARYGEELRATLGEASGRQRRHALYRGDELLAVMHTTWRAPGEATG